MPVTKEIVRAVRRRVAERPGVHTSQLAEELNTSEVDVIMALPLSMRLRARLSDLEAIWEGMARWKNTVIAMAWPTHTHGSAYDGHADTGIPKLYYESIHHDIGSIWFVSENVDHDEVTHSVRLFDKDGNPLLSVSLGKNHLGRVDAQSKAEYDAMRLRFGVRPHPKMRCKGCVSCTCHKGGAHHHHHS